MISVCMTTYNGEKFIREQINSILPQLGENDELVISDDSSTDKTIALIEEYNDKRIRILKNNKFHSPIFNLENALKNAKGDYIFLADQDDIWLPEKVSETLKHITENNVVMTDAMLVDVGLNMTADSLDSWRSYKRGFFSNLFMSRYLGCCMAFHKKKLQHILPFPRNIKAHDVWIGLLAELYGGLTYIPVSMIKYRRHENNYSSVSSKSLNSVFFMMSYRAYFFFFTIGRTLKFYLKNL